MGLPKYLIIEGKTYRWRDLLRMRREQKKPEPKQPTLFPLKDDFRPPSQRTPEGRLTEPPLFPID